MAAQRRVAEICVHGFESDKESELWSVRLPAANEIVELD
jgi:hypothetical protein